ncbi:pilus assembly protein PilM [Patescibacteria group bacterium]|nr:pilus assembly protein PilM [Patescibacteria group bacterium]MBU1563965.1 pilus assembly protein PilM [Patescibacteria group bacterium]MBU2068295.1 pilus assembly protein PilM [Patescibacteria group bacterium]
MFLFKKKLKKCLGIDISASSVKIIELEKEDGRHKLTNYAIFSLKKYFENKGQEFDKEYLNIPNEEMGRIIKETIKEAKIESRDVYLSIPVYSSFYTLINFSNLSEKEIETAIPFEARKYVPVPISEVVLDWSIVSLPNNPKSQQALLIAVPKKIINDYNEIVRLAGLTLRGIEGETFSLTRALIGNDKSVIILIDNGARSINISIIDDGYIRVTHNLEMGGRKITQAIVQQMGFDSEKAEHLKRKLSDNDFTDHVSTQLKGIVQSSLGVIIIEIKKIIDSYQSKYNRKIEKCILVGSGTHLFDFVDSLINKLSLDAVMGDPFARIVSPSILKPVLKDLGPPLAVAIGLAMRDE